MDVNIDSNHSGSNSLRYFDVQDTDIAIRLMIVYI